MNSTEKETYLHILYKRKRNWMMMETHSRLSLNPVIQCIFKVFPTSLEEEMVPPSGANGSLRKILSPSPLPGQRSAGLLPGIKDLSSLGKLQAPFLQHVWPAPPGPLCISLEDLEFGGRCKCWYSEHWCCCESLSHLFLTHVSCQHLWDCAG